MDTPETKEIFQLYRMKAAMPWELEPLVAAIEIQRNEAKAILETVCFHLRRNDHVTPPTGATCTNQIIDRIERFLLGNAIAMAPATLEPESKNDVVAG